MATGRGGDADVLVVGAGLAGLAAAHRLSQDGLGALVLEREDEPGGRARSEQWAGCTIELGATFLTPAYRRLRRLIDECGLGERLEPLPNGLRTAIRRDGRWHHLDARWPELALLRYRGIGWRDKASLARLLGPQLRVARSLRFFDLASAAAVDTHPLDAVVGNAANRYFTSAIAEVLCSAPAEEFSLAFGVLGSRYPLRRPWILRGGLGSLTAELARRLGTRSGVAVKHVRVDGDEVVAETAQAETLRARAVILATRAPEALEVWPAAPEWTRRFLRDQAYSRGLGVFLRASAPVRRTDPRGRDLLLEVIPRSEDTGVLLAIIYLNELAPDGGLLGLGASPHAVAASSDDDTELAAQLESEFGELHPELQPQVTARRTLRWPVYVPSYPTGRARELAAFRARLTPGPIQLAGDYLYGPLMEAAVRAGEEAAERVSQHLDSTS